MTKLGDLAALTAAFAALGAACLDPPLGAGQDTPREGERYEHRGTCDGSGAVALDGDHFLAANDEDNVLRLYRARGDGGPLQELDLDAFLEVSARRPEADLEGAARLGDDVYWITSHGRNGDGELRPNRYRFFAVRVRSSAGGFELEPVGEPVDDLLEAMLESPELEGLGLEDASQLDKKKLGKLAPKEEGLNVEGLAAGADGESLWIALRNPRPGGRALLVPLLSPSAVIAGAAPRFGEPVLLDLAGRGVRAIERAPDHGGYLLIAGPAAGGGRFALYRWSGERGAAAEELAELPSPRCGPEAIVVYPGERSVQVLDDCGTDEIDGVECKDREASERRFTSFFVVPPGALPAPPRRSPPR